MNENTCARCGVSIPDDQQTCWGCEHNEMKVGFILQSLGATKDEVDCAYSSLKQYEKRIRKQRRECS